jgi:hypothetical protein
MTLRSAFLAFSFCVCGLNLFAAPCDMDPGDKPQLVIARYDAKHAWAAYKSYEELTKSSGTVPVLSLQGGMSADIWKAPNGTLLVRTVAPGDGFEAYTKSCYSRAGYLVYVSFELRTGWGWNYRAEGPIVMERFRRSVEQYSDSKSDKPLVVRPQQPDDNPKMMIPELHMRVKQLPFASLLDQKP